MGYALAAAAARRGARVTLVSGPTGLPIPAGVERVDAVTAADMHRAVQDHAAADLVIMAAAVADYTPAEVSPTKVKKQDGDLTLRFRRTVDILAELGRTRRPGQVLVGFALETNDALANARHKLAAKNLDWIVLNDATEPGAGFGPATNRVTLIARDGTAETLPLLPKPAVAEALLDRIARSPR
jgi:phosphopantothenoylcysteine decarboxylase/phosphopantothenate--cysteine ligase